MTKDYQILQANIDLIFYQVDLFDESGFQQDVSFIDPRNNDSQQFC